MVIPCLLPELHALIAVHLGQDLDEKNDVGKPFRTFAAEHHIFIKTTDTQAEFGRIITRCNGVVHSFGDKPAIVYTKVLCGRMEWYHEGKLHRGGDQPAVVDPDRNLKQWWNYGKQHRGNDLPAVVDGRRKQWWRHGKLHRGGNLPAYESSESGRKEWWRDGKIIRAVIDDRWWWKENPGSHPEGPYPG